MLRAHPQIGAEIAAGEFGMLHSWLKQNVYQHGRTCACRRISERRTGGPLSFEPYIRYLRRNMVSCIVCDAGVSLRR